MIGCGVDTIRKNTISSVPVVRGVQTRRLLAVGPSKGLYLLLSCSDLCFFGFQGTRLLAVGASQRRPSFVVLICILFVCCRAAASWWWAPARGPAGGWPPRRRCAPHRSSTAALLQLERPHRKLHRLASSSQQGAAACLQPHLHLCCARAAGCWPAPRQERHRPEPSVRSLFCVRCAAGWSPTPGRRPASPRRCSPRSQISGRPRRAGV